MAHTPGPWTIRHGTNVFGKDIHYPNSERVVANAGGHDNNRFFEEVSEENKSNAILIAAAPDLLAACEKVYNAINWRCTEERLSQLKQADILRAAIEKSKGA